MRKKSIYVLACIILASFLLSSCGLITISESSKSPYSSHSPTVAHRPTNTPVPTATPTPEFASRQNPAQVNEAVVVTGKDWTNANYEYQIVVTKVIRGGEANKKLTDENMFNSIPEGKEALLAWVEFTLKKYEHPSDGYYSLSSYDFDFFKDGTTGLDSSLLVVPNELGAELYENGFAEGYVCACVTPGDIIFARYDNYVWINLG